jgi:hypothetical protein
MSKHHPTNGRTERAAYLYRNSDDRQENSVQRQRQGVEPYARHKGYEVIAEYVFDGIPGDEIGSHPDWHRLMKDGGSGADLNIIDNATNRIITGIGNSTAEYLDIASAGMLQFTSQTGFGDLAYQNIEVTGVVNMRVAGGTSTSCNVLIPAGNSYGISHSDANFSGGRLNITADNPPQAGFSVTLVSADPDASISNDFSVINKPAGTSHVFNSSKWTLTDP